MSNNEIIKKDPVKVLKGRHGGEKGSRLGIPNKVTAEIKQKVKIFVEYNIEDLQKEYKKLKSKEKLMFMKEILEYVLPKLARVEQKSEGKLEININKTW